MPLPPKNIDDIPNNPKFESVVEERAYRKQRLLGALRLFGLLGYDDGVSGHISVRDPEHSEHFWVNPFGRYFGVLKTADLLLVDGDGKILEGRPPLNMAAFAIQSSIHKARPDVVAVAHAHTMHGRAWSSLGRLLDPIHQDACAFYEDHVVYEGYDGLVYDPNEGARIAAGLGKHKAAFLRNHGHITVGHSVDEAAWWFILMDRCCQIQMLAEQVGKPKLLPHELAKKTQEQTGFPQAGWFQFQPLWQRIVLEQPDFLENAGEVRPRR